MISCWLQGMVGLVTGGASGLGKATVERLIKEGGKIVICDLPSSKGHELSKEIGSNTIFSPVDVSIYQLSLLSPLRMEPSFSGGWWHHFDYLAVFCTTNERSDIRPCLVLQSCCLLSPFPLSFFLINWERQYFLLSIEFLFILHKYAVTFH